MRGRVLRPVAAAGTAALLIAIIGGTLTDIGPWYQSLRQPAFKPPDWLFAPAWTLIYALCVAAATIAWRRARAPADRETMVGLFALNGFLNVLWSLLFFRLHRPDWALVEVGFLWLSVAALIVVLGRYARPAALLLTPYLVWVSFASAVNAVVVRLNGPFG